MSRQSAAKVARWLVSKNREDEAVALLAAWAVTGPNDPEGHELLAEALRIRPGAEVARQAFSRMEGVTSSGQAHLDEALAHFGSEALAKLEKEATRPVFMRAQMGFNNNVKYQGLVFHIQTEDSGLDRPHVITHLFGDGGRVIKSHKRTYESDVQKPDVGALVKALMKGQHMEMALMLREGRFDAVIAGKALGGMEVLATPPRTEIQKLATKKEERAAVNEAPVIRTDPSLAPVSPASLAPPPTPSRASLAPKVARPAPFRLVVARSLSGGPAYYEPSGDSAVIGRTGAITIPGERFCHAQEAQIRHVKGRIWLRDLEAGNGVFLRVHKVCELGVGDEFIVGDQLLRIERNPDPNDGPGAGPTYFYSSPKWPSSFRVVQIFEGGARGACVVARGTTMQIGSLIGDFVFTNDPLVSDQHCLIEEQAGTILLTDLDSRTGVFVRIKGEQELVHGDELLVGRTRLVLEVASTRA